MYQDVRPAGQPARGVEREAPAPIKPLPIITKPVKPGCFGPNGVKPDLMFAKKYEKPPNPNRPKGEEHSRVPKGPQGPNK